MEPPLSSPADHVSRRGTVLEDATDNDRKGQPRLPREPRKGRERQREEKEKTRKKKKKTKKRKEERRGEERGLSSVVGEERGSSLAERERERAMVVSGE